MYSASFHILHGINIVSNLSTMEEFFNIMLTCNVGTLNFAFSDS